MFDNRVVIATDPDIPGWAHPTAYGEVGLSSKRMPVATATVRGRTVLFIPGMAHEENVWYDDLSPERNLVYHSNSSGLLDWVKSLRGDRYIIAHSGSHKDLEYEGFDYRFGRNSRSYTYLRAMAPHLLKSGKKRVLLPDNPKLAMAQLNDFESTVKEGRQYALGTAPP